MLPAFAPALAQESAPPPTSQESAPGDADRVLEQASALLRRTMKTLEQTSDTLSADKAAEALNAFLAESKPLWLNLEELDLVNDDWFSTDPSLSGNAAWERFKDDVGSFSRCLMQYDAMFSAAGYYGSTRLRNAMKKFFCPVRSDTDGPDDATSRSHSTLRSETVSRMAPSRLASDPQRGKQSGDVSELGRRLRPVETAAS